jgi:putative hydrolase of the HAD superfamily
MSRFDIIAFDADDTLWHTERLYVDAQSKFVQLLSLYHRPEWIQERLDETEGRNLAHFGFVIKAFALSMIETAVELTEGRVSGRDIGALVGIARDMLNAEVQLLDDAADTIAQLARQYPLMLITKGDLLDQENKIKRSGLANYFPRIEIVSHKTPESYARLLEQHRITPSRFLMVGNSLKSDILPVLELGSSAVHVPYELTWLHERAEPPPDGHAGYYKIERLKELPALLALLEQGERPTN